MSTLNGLVYAVRSRQMTKWSLSVGGLGLWLAAASCTASGPAPGAGPAPDGSSSSAEAVQFTAKVVERNGGAAIPGARICVVDLSDIPCATSASDGSYTISMPVWTTDVDFAFNATAAGHLGSTWLLHEAPGDASWPTVQQLYDDAAATDLMSHAGFAGPGGGKGSVLLSVYRASQGAAGMTVTSSPAGGGPVYLDPTGTPDPALTGLTTDGYALLGNLAPGPIEITVSDTSCTQTFLTNGSYFGMWADAKPATIAGVTVADSITQMNMVCPP